MDPDAPDLTFGPQPGDYLSRNRARGVATPPRGPPAGRGQHEFPWLRWLWRPGVHRLTNTLVPVKIYAQTKSDVSLLSAERSISHPPAGCLEPTVHAEFSSTCTISAREN